MHNQVATQHRRKWNVRQGDLLLFIAFVLFFPCSGYAKDGGPSYDASAQLTPQQFERVKICKNLLQEADLKSLDETVEELEQARNPEQNLQILEAIALTYSEISKEQKVEAKADKEWLHSMVALNMAYLQLGGGEGGRDTALNRLIRGKLKEHLSTALLHDPELFHSVSDWE